MQKIEVTSPQAQSADLVSANIEQLKKLFPELLTESANGMAVNVDVLKALVGDKTATDSDEKYGLNWHGKRRARQLALTPSIGTLRPCPDESVDWDTTQNLMIEGDNLEVLKLLQKSYAGKVKLIYIDPPYNTGKDFVYPDNFQDNIKNYLELTGQTEGGAKISSNTEASGRFHTDWLNMMYPRLKLARNLLRDDGFILLSIDDAELVNIRRLMDEVFGEENEIATLIWDRNRKNDAKFFSVGHEYMLVFARSKSRQLELGTVLREPKQGIDEARELFERLKVEHSSNWENIRLAWRDFFRAVPEDDPRKPLGRFTKISEKGPYRDDGDISWPGGGGPKYEIHHPITKRLCKVPAGGWVYPAVERFWEEVSRGRVVFGDDETTLPRQCRFLFEGDGQVMRSVNYSYAQTAMMDFVSLMDERVFDNPKYWGDLRRLTQYLTGPTDIVLDFFAGSGSTGHAVIAQNALDSGSRRYILVQLPERLDPENKDQKKSADYCDKLGKSRNLAEITKERLRRAASKIRAAHASQTRAVGQLSLVDSPQPVVELPDLGFRVFKLDHSNIRAWNPKPTDLAQAVIDFQDHVMAGRTESDILYELLLKLGLDLCVPIVTRQLAGLTVYAVGGGVLLACLAPAIASTEVDALATGIIAWRKELLEAGGYSDQDKKQRDTTCVFRDSAFADDIAKTNLSAILEQQGIQNVRSL